MFLQCTNALSNATVLSLLRHEAWTIFLRIQFSAGRDKLLFFSILLLPSEHSLLSKNILNFNFINKHSNVYQALQLAYCKCTKFYALLSSVLQVTHWLFFAWFVFFSLLQFFAFYFTHSQRVQCSLLIVHSSVPPNYARGETDTMSTYCLLLMAMKLFGPRREQNLACWLVGWLVGSFYSVVVFRFQFLFLHCITDSRQYSFFFSKWNSKRISQW